MTRPLRVFRRLFLSGLIVASGLLSGCYHLALQGQIEGNLYHAPAQAYDIPLDINLFRGTVALDERCDASGGSTSFWDEADRQFTIDYLKVDANELAKTPAFASEQTMLNLVLNNYLRNVIKNSGKVQGTDTTTREYIRNDEEDFRGLFALINMDVDTLNEPGSPPIRGTYYYGFLLFKRGEIFYVLQHRQPAYMPEKMKQTLLALKSHMRIPGTGEFREHPMRRAARRINNFYARIGIPGREIITEEQANVCKLTGYN